ncbi:hypothetical protein Vadar_002449 [Vaccinium darrowii]|uniref:Uncharacterized protein n=1 Tax=Vaccinium darrowii TaxID=229202 RepID=A0ACB7YJA0_9ERIC|nr:hypothetical protein Vadar_002449 [Vaccinium darrowii]
METKNKRNALEKIRRRLQFSNSCYVDPVGLSGGLALWWKEEVDVEVRFKSKNILRCIITWPSSSNRWLGTFIYAPPVWQQRVDFWNYLRSIHAENQLPWLCVGDFNEVGSIWEKQGGEACKRSRVERFQQLLSDCEMMDLEFKGPAYTWSNNQGWAGNIRERLDRAVANIEWRSLYPYAQVFHDLLLGSDHCPLIINVCIPLKKVPYQFKFESMWCTSDECGEVISGAWGIEHRGSAMFNLFQKLKKCREALMPWSRKKFGNNKKRVKDLKAQLGIVQQKAFSEENFIQERALKEELEITLLREEMYQHQRSRLNWIMYGDKNTSFFHATVIQRRQRNQLSKIKDSEGNWISEENEINEHLYDYFSSLFKSSGSRNFDSVLQKVDCCITDEMNRGLTRMVTEEEVKEATFQLGSLKAPGPDGFQETPKVQMDNPPIQEDNSNWRAPDKGKFKVNCDVALPPNGKEGKVAVILRDWKGKILDGFAKQITAASSLKGELLAIRAACEMVFSLGLKEVEVESDNKQAILLSVSESVPPWEVRAVVLDIRHLAVKGAISFRWTRREANKAAHEVAALALRNLLPCNWIVYPPSLFSVLCKDVSL